MNTLINKSKNVSLKTFVGLDFCSSRRIHHFCKLNGFFRCFVMSTKFKILVKEKEALSKEDEIFLRSKMVSHSDKNNFKKNYKSC
jgi:hypothetical protein